MTGDVVPANRPGRPSSFNADRAARLLTAVRAGNCYDAAAAHAGISYSTLRRWVLRSEDPDAPEALKAFRDELEKARADAEVHSVAVIRKAAQEGSWQAAAWLLERSRPEQWGRRDTNRIEVVGHTDGGNATQVVGGIELSAAGMNALAQRLARRRQEAEEDENIVDAEIVDDMEEALDVFLDDEGVQEEIREWDDGE